MNRNDFQQLTELRIREAEALRKGRFFDGAYYLLGYAVESAFKACFSKQIQQYDFPEKKLIDGVHTHDLDRLLALSGVKTAFDQIAMVNVKFRDN